MVKNERLFVRFYEPNSLFCPAVDNEKPTDRGREQFAAHQSRGVTPDAPDPYFTVLSGGKRAFDLLCRELEQAFVGSGSWWGTYALWEDWKGERWVLPHLLGWYKRVTGFTQPRWWSMEGEWNAPEIQEAVAESRRVLCCEWARKVAAA